MNTSRIEDKLNNQLGTQLESVSDQIQKGIQSGKYTLAELQKAVVDKTKYAAKTTDDYVHDNPWTALGIAAGVGLLIGFLANRR